MTHDVQEIVKMIDTSFLSDGDKETLREEFKKSGTSDTFWTAFHAAFENDFKKRGAVFGEAVDTFESTYHLLEKAYAEKRQHLEEKLENDIGKIDPINTAGKESIFSAYYLEIDNAQNQFQNDAKELYAETATTMVKKVG